MKSVVSFVETAHVRNYPLDMDKTTKWATNNFRRILSKRSQNKNTIIWSGSYPWHYNDQQNSHKKKKKKYIYSLINKTRPNQNIYTNVKICRLYSEMQTTWKLLFDWLNFILSNFHALIFHFIWFFNFVRWIICIIQNERPNTFWIS